MIFNDEKVLFQWLRKSFSKMQVPLRMFCIRGNPGDKFKWSTNTIKTLKVCVQVNHWPILQVASVSSVPRGQCGMLSHSNLEKTQLKGLWRSPQNTNTCPSRFLGHIDGRAVTKSWLQEKACESKFYFCTLKITRVMHTLKIHYNSQSGALNNTNSSTRPCLPNIPK